MIGVGSDCRHSWQLAWVAPLPSCGCSMAAVHYWFCCTGWAGGRYSRAPSTRLGICPGNPQCMPHILRTRAPLMKCNMDWSTFCHLQCVDVYPTSTECRQKHIGAWRQVSFCLLQRALQRHVHWFGNRLCSNSSIRHEWP